MEQIVCLTVEKTREHYNLFGGLIIYCEVDEPPASLKTLQVK